MTSCSPTANAGRHSLSCHRRSFRSKARSLVMPRPARAVQPVGQAEGGLQERQRLEGEEPERAAGCRRPCPPPSCRRGGSAHCASRSARRRRNRSPSRAAPPRALERRRPAATPRRAAPGGSACPHVVVESHAVPRCPAKESNAALVRRAHTRNVKLNSKFAYKLNTSRPTYMQRSLPPAHRCVRRVDLHRTLRRSSRAPYGIRVIASVGRRIPEWGGRE